MVCADNMLIDVEQEFCSYVNNGIQLAGYNTVFSALLIPPPPIAVQGGVADAEAVVIPDYGRHPAPAQPGPTNVHDLAPVFRQPETDLIPMSAVGSRTSFSPVGYAFGRGLADGSTAAVRLLVIPARSPGNQDESRQFEGGFGKPGKPLQQRHEFLVFAAHDVRLHLFRLPGEPGQDLPSNEWIVSGYDFDRAHA
jgi:hypothetical protein